MRIIAIGIIFIVILFSIVAAGGYFYLEAQTKKPLSAVSRAEKVFEIKRGESVSAIAGRLAKEGFISDRFFFKYAVWKSDIGGSLKAGKYLLNSGMSPLEMARLMAEGRVWRDEVAVTIPEGFNLREIDARLKAAGFLVSGSPALADLTAGDFKKDYDFLADAPDSVSLEGYLFPDTYHFEKNTSLENAVRKMLDNFDKKLSTDLREEARKQSKTIFEIVTMASIIEKEVITTDDMKLVSGVLWKRLEIGMPLQADATVAYVTGHGELTRDDLKTDTPYNTYTRQGLPKGPISNPGLRAIQAAIYPTLSDYLYYLSKPTKETVFSRTLDEHNRAKEKYLK
ncbi:MAG TPA: endolytic transglycosylase MltG [Candidatus Paceibacterota bacterium]